MPYRSVFRSDLFTGQTIIVTGGGTGIGRCTAHELIALGARVVLIGRRMEKLEATAGEIAAEGGAAECHACDIRDEEGVKRTVAAIVAAHGRIHGLVNNAGGQFAAPLTGISMKGWDAVVRNNLTGGFLMMREVFAQSMERHGGAIVNITADLMWRGAPTMGHTGAARAGMDNLSKTAAVEWASSGVRVNVVAPGWVATSGMDTYDEKTKALFRTLHRHLPLQRLGVEAEVSAAIVFLLSDAAAFITGESLRVDGGAPLSTVAWPMPEHDRSQPYEGFHLAELPEVLRGR